MGQPNDKKEVWLRRQALQVAIQLPDDPQEAREVLTYAIELVTGFIERGVKGAAGCPRACSQRLRLIT